MKIIYLGFDLFCDCFSALADIKDIEIMALHTYKTDNVFEFNKDVKKIAADNGIPVFDDRITEKQLNGYFDNGCDLIISAGYIYKIPVLARRDFKGINIHPSLLPAGRGAWPYPCTILKGLRESGVTVHKISEGFDEGDILLKSAFSVDENETLDTLTEKSQFVAKELLLEVMSNFNEYWQNALPQSGGEYWQEPGDGERTLTENMTVKEAKRIIRAFGSYGVIYGGEVFKGFTGQKKEICLADGKLLLKY